MQGKDISGEPVFCTVNLIVNSGIHLVLMFLLATGML